MDVLIWIGAVISALGLAGLVWCIVAVSRAKRAKLPDEELRAILKTVVPRNLAALFLSVIGLMMVILGISFSG